MGRHRDNERDYSPFEDDYRGFDMTEDDSARGPLILALAVGVLLVFGAVVWNTYRQGVRDSAAGIPSVIADKTPYKRAPEDREGIAVPDTDKRFYDQMDDSERAQESYGMMTEGADSDSQSLQGGPPIELRPGREGVEPDDEQVRALADLESLPEDEEEPLRAAPSTRLSDTDPVVVSPRAQPAQATSRFAFSSDGAFLVQLAAFRSEDAAEAAWAGLHSSKPDLFSDAQKRIQRADLGAKGVFYRLRVGNFAERSDAAEFCDAVKAEGDNCIVVTG